MLWPRDTAPTEPEAWPDRCHLAPSRGLERRRLTADLKGPVEAVLSCAPIRAPWLSTRAWAQPGACALGSVRLSRDRPRAGALGGLKARRFQTSVWPPGSLYLPSRRPPGPARWPCPPALQPALSPPLPAPGGLSSAQPGDQRSQPPAQPGWPHHSGEVCWSGWVCFLVFMRGPHPCSHEIPQPVISRQVAAWPVGGSPRLRSHAP